MMNKVVSDMNQVEFQGIHLDILVSIFSTIYDLLRKKHFLIQIGEKERANNLTSLFQL